MLLAHLADLHLGYRAYHRLAPGGVNARERDVALAFRAALDRIIELRPDLVLVAGDVFHSVRPPNSAIADAFRQFARLRAALPDAPVVIIAGNHDSPRAVETGSILRLLGEIPGIVVVDDDARAIRLDALDASVLCLPHNALAGEQRVAVEPDPGAATNLLMLHGTITGGGAEEKLRWVSEYGGAQLDCSEIRPDRWDYIAVGHHHIATELAPNMWYAGAIERTSTNIWAEAAGEKGFLTYDTETRRATFHAVPTRPVLDLPRLSARRAANVDVDEPANAAEPGPEPANEPVHANVPVPGRYLSSAELDAAIQARVDSIPGGLAGRIVRLVIEDVPRELYRELDHARIREWKAEALHFHLDPRRPEVRRVSASGAPYRRRTLDEEVEVFLSRVWQPVSGEIDRARLVALAAKYLGEAGREETADALVDAEVVLDAPVASGGVEG